MKKFATKAWRKPITKSVGEAIAARDTDEETSTTKMARDGSTEPRRRRFLSQVHSRSESEAQEPMTASDYQLNAILSTLDSTCAELAESSGSDVPTIDIVVVHRELNALHGEMQPRGRASRSMLSLHSSGSTSRAARFDAVIERFDECYGLLAGRCLELAFHGRLSLVQQLVQIATADASPATELVSFGCHPIVVEL